MMLSKYAICLFTLILLFILPSKIFAQNADFNISVQSEKGVISDFTFTISQPTGPETLSNIELVIPSGWEIKNGSELTEAEIIGKGNLNFVLNGVARQIPVIIINSQNTQGHKAYWKIVFGDQSSPFVTIDSFIDGDIDKGHQWTMERKFFFNIEPPITFDLAVNASYITKPAFSGTSVFEVIINFVGGISKIIQKSLALI